VVGHGARDEGVREAVEAVLAQVVVRGDLLVDGVRVVRRRDGQVEAGVEAGDLGRRWEIGLQRFDDGECWCVVPVICVA